MMDYGFKLVMPDPSELANAGFGKVGHIPAVFDSEPGYARLPSRFLIDRALGVWDPLNRGVKPNPRRPSRVSIKNFGYWLCNALEWADVRGIDLMTCDYSEVLIGQYQDEMLKGIWSLQGAPLAAQTVNARVDVALEFQMWCADHGYREPFLVSGQMRSYKAGSHRNSKSHEIKTVAVRNGKVKVGKLDLVFPADEEIRRWRKRVSEQPVVGATHVLMVDHVLQTAIRREELACWRVDTLPENPKLWVIVNPDQPEEFQQVSVTFGQGAKGREFFIDEYGDKMGPRGNIKLPLSLCKRIDEYRNKERVLALKNITRGVRDLAKARQLIEQTVHLYLHPTTGKRYTGDQIFRMWTRGERPAQWSPHLGRNWWACKRLWERMEDHSALIKLVQGMTNPEVDHPLLFALKDTALQVIQFEIQPQLRHASSTTTVIYLQWLFNQLRVPLNMTRLWHEE